MKAPRQGPLHRSISCVSAESVHVSGQIHSPRSFAPVPWLPLRRSTQTLGLGPEHPPWPPPSWPQPNRSGATAALRPGCTMVEVGR